MRLFNYSKFFPKQSRPSQAGSAMLAAILATTMVAGSAVYAYKNFNITQDSLRAARIKSMMSVVEGQLRRRALQPDAYLNCNTSGTGSCGPNLSFFADLERKIPGAKCPAGPGAQCGIKLTLNFNTAAKVLAATIAYEGKETKIKPTEITISIPTEVLQADSFHCGRMNPSKPIFVGFDPTTGRPVCEGFHNPCPAGKFVSGVNLNTRSFVCKDLPGPQSCSPQMFDHLTWQGNDLQRHCRDRDTPPFVSNLTVRYPASNPPPDQTRPRIDTVTRTETRTQTQTVIEAGPQSPPPPPPPPPTPTCRTESVSLGMGNGATPRVFGAMSCTVSCTGTFNANSYCAGACVLGYRDWYYCMDCREDKQVCN